MSNINLEKTFDKIINYSFYLLIKKKLSELHKNILL